MTEDEEPKSMLKPKRTTEMVSIIDDMKNRNGLHDHLLRELDKELSTPQPNISDIVENLKKSDTEINDTAIIDMFRVECQVKSDQLHHRANMLRMRADELDKMADKIGGPVLEATVKVIQTAANALRNIDETLRSHAHIEPNRHNTE